MSENNNTVESVDEEEFELLNIFRPTEPEKLAGYSVEITSEWETSSGIGATADVYLNEEHIFSFEVDDRGGCNKYLASDEVQRAHLSQFRKLVKELYPKTPEPEDLAVSWIEFYP
jgi:hypothetical protein